MSLLVYTTKQNGWRLAVADDPAPAPEVIQAALELADSKCVPLRRSRHARTFLLRSASGKEDADLFVKHLDPPAGWERLKSWFRRARPFRTARITAALRHAGFLVPPILLYGVHR
ncbi:MAG: hypothetical protein JO189_02695, partial [Deltaproteobacteria bacterium]|nr:hypothetical protein [Deltaproteobacteria bacterium]